MQVVLYSQDCHNFRRANARLCRPINLLKSGAKGKEKLASHGVHGLKRNSPSAAAHPGRQISGEVAFRGVQAASLTGRRPRVAAYGSATTIHTGPAMCR